MRFSRGEGILSGLWDGEAGGARKRVRFGSAQGWIRY